MILSQGDIVYFDYSPTRGHEPAGRRPSVVVSSDEFNMRTSLTLCCPVTTTRNGYPLHLELPDDADVDGCVCVEQMRAVDLESRGCKVVGHLDRATIARIVNAVKLCF